MAERGCGDCLGLEPWPEGLKVGSGVHIGMSEALPVVNYGLTEEGWAGRQDQRYPPPCPGLELYSGPEFQRAHTENFHTEHPIWSPGSPSLQISYFRLMDANGFC